MKKILAALIVIFLTGLCIETVQAQQNPIHLQRVKPVRQNKCLLKVVAYLDGKPHAFSRLRDMDYTLANGTHMTMSNPQHPWNNCDITNLGEVSRFSTGLMKSGLNVQVEVIKDPAKSAFITTYGDRHEAIMEKLAADSYDLMADYTKYMKWNTAIMYILPPSVVTQNEEPVAVYCKLPAGVKDDPALSREEKRKICTTSYILPGGLGFGYTYLESPREYKLTEIDKGARDYFAGTAVKEVKEQAPAP